MITTGQTSPTTANPPSSSEPIESSERSQSGSGTMEMAVGPVSLRTKSHAVKIAVVSLCAITVVWFLVLLTIERISV